jgi:hypothetical protein
MELEDTDCEANRRKFNHQVGIVRDALNDTKGPPGWKAVGPFKQLLWSAARFTDKGWHVEGAKLQASTGACSAGPRAAW